jgi:hypothetical protein
MNKMKKISFLFLVIFMLFSAGNVFAHDRGDLMLNIEPQLGLLFTNVNSNYYYYDSSRGTGVDLALRFSVHYYFIGLLGINFGFELNYINGNSATGVFFNVPFGLRFSLGALAIGAGLSYNYHISDYSDTRYGYDIYLNNYFSWYADLGFDLSGRANRNSGFGMMLRLKGPFNNYANSIIYNYSYVSLSLCFQIAIQTASLPIGGRR